MRVLVTGATGFIGRQVLPLLTAGGHEVFAVGRRERPPSLVEDVQWHTCDLLDSAQLSQLLSETGPTDLLHFAWYAEPSRYWSAPENVLWVESTLQLFRRFVESGGTRVVMAGTCAEYDLRHGFCSEGLTPLRPTTLYGASKHAVATVVTTAAEHLGVSAAWGRIFFLYGPREHPARLVAGVATALLRGEPAACSHGRQLRDFLHVKDVASAFVHLLHSDLEGPVNVASGTAVSVGEVALAIGELVGRPELVQLGTRSAPADEPPLIVADVRRLEQEVGWEPRITLTSGLRETVDWWRHNL